MANRLTRIYTRTGDGGSTGLADGSRVDKDSARVRAMGDVDELNCCIGAVLLQPLPEGYREALIDVQHALFDVGGELAIPGHSAVTATYVSTLEGLLDRFNAQLPPLQEFILPGGGEAAVACHLARAVCRRAERELVALAREEVVNADSRRYLNRLSDLLFVMARVCARAAHGEVYWQPGRLRGQPQ